MKGTRREFREESTQGYARLRKTSVKIQSINKLLYNRGDTSSRNVGEHWRRMTNRNYVLGTREPSSGGKVRSDKRTKIQNIPFW